MGNMPQHIFINQESTNDHISIFYVEPAFIVVANKDDLAKINLLEESHKPGIYILIGNTKRYIGQASGAIFSRLQQHNINKNWWNKIIFFGRDDAHLSKAQLDYIEGQLIKEFSQTDFELENNTVGNKSYIDKLGKMYASSLLSLTKTTLSNIANINLLDDNQLHQIDTKVNSDSNFVVFLGEHFSGNSARKVFSDIMTKVIKTERLDKLAPIISDDEPSTVRFIGTSERISHQGVKLTKMIAGTSYHVYANFSKDAMIKKLQLVAQLLNKDIDINI